jgi:hypothetical protein
MSIDYEAWARGAQERRGPGTEYTERVTTRRLNLPDEGLTPLDLEDPGRFTVFRPAALVERLTLTSGVADRHTFSVYGPVITSTGADHGRLTGELEWTVTPVSDGPATGYAIDGPPMPPDLSRYVLGPWRMRAITPGLIG